MGESRIREYYRNYLILNRKINRLLQLREIWESRAENTSSTLSFTPKSTPTENLQELAVCRMIEYGRLADDMTDELVRLRKSVECYIRLTGCQDSRLAEILRVEE